MYQQVSGRLSLVAYICGPCGWCNICPMRASRPFVASAKVENPVTSDYRWLTAAGHPRRGEWKRSAAAPMAAESGDDDERTARLIRLSFNTGGATSREAGRSVSGIQCSAARGRRT